MFDKEENEFNKNNELYIVEHPIKYIPIVQVVVNIDFDYTPIKIIDDDVYISAINKYMNKSTSVLAIEYNVNILDNIADIVQDCVEDVDIDYDVIICGKKHKKKTDA